jgi:hypothetical protein
MLELLIVIGRALALALRGHRELVLEHLALRQQLTMMRRTTSRPHLAGVRPTVSDRLGPNLAELAHGVGACAAGHRCAVASGLASPPIEPTFEAPTRTAVHPLISRSASSSERWRRRIRYGEHLGFTVS